MRMGPPLPGAPRPTAMARILGSWLLLATLWALAGCAQPPRAPHALEPANHWSGRLALQVDGQAAQSFSAGFDLQGDAGQGELTLFNPLGGVLARLHWRPGHATLQSGGETQASASLDALLQQATGTSIPINALFGWLTGLHTRAEGWQADLSAIDQGRLVARRHAPAPHATLRIALDR